jgi:hypothetical protein
MESSNFTPLQYFTFFLLSYSLSLLGKRFLLNFGPVALTLCSDFNPLNSFYFLVVYYSK